MSLPAPDTGLTLGSLLISTTIIYILYKSIEFLLRIPRITHADKYVLVTGCDTGFGRHLVQRLLGTSRCHVIATCLTPEGVLEVGRLGPRVLGIQMDVSTTDSIHNAYRQSLEFIPKDKGLWGIVNNAGIFGTLGPSDWLQRDDFQQSLDVNILGMIDVTNTWLPLVKRARGRVINMSSVLGRLAVPFSATYCVSKFAVQAYTAALRVELSTCGVSVHLVEPGAFNTKFTDQTNIKRLSRKAWTRLPPHLKDEYGEAFVDTMVDAGVDMLRLTMSSREQPVVDAYEHALFAKFPKRRYTVGLDSTVYVLLSYCPQWVVDCIFRVSGILPAKSKTA